MKLELSKKLLLNVRPQSAEEEREVADLFDGVYEVRVGAHPAVAFVPAVDWNASVWPPMLPANPDRPTTAQEARRLVLATAALAVTPNGERAGATERLAPIDPDLPAPVVFYVAEADFSVYENELATVAVRTPFVTTSVALSEYADFQFVKLLVDHVLV